MKTKLISQKLPHLVDYALAIAVHNVPGMAEADSGTKQLYQTLAKEMLLSELKLTQMNAARKFRNILKVSDGVFHKCARKLT
ncbi:uncharacterized protein YutE (UPF0331/DUF86 family) [Pedobacter sp. UYP24]